MKKMGEEEFRIEFEKTQKILVECFNLNKFDQHVFLAVLIKIIFFLICQYKDKQAIKITLDEINRCCEEMMPEWKDE